MPELLAQITTPRFVAAIVLVDDKVTVTAPILRFMRGWSRERVRTYCRNWGWHIEIVPRCDLARLS